MNITVQCPHCKTVLHSDDSYCGKAVQCSQCSQSFIVGQGTPAAVPPPVAPTASLSQPAGTYDAAGQNYYPRQTCGKATAALACSIIGLMCCQVGSILGIVFGFLAKGEIRDSNGRLEGDTMATVSIVLGFLGLALVVIFFLLYFVVPGIFIWIAATMENM